MSGESICEIVEKAEQIIDRATTREQITHYINRLDDLMDRAQHKRYELYNSKKV